MIDIRDHGGQFGGGKYRKGTKIPVGNTDLKLMPYEIITNLGWNQSIENVCVHHDKSFTIIYRAGTYWWIRGFDSNGQVIFDFCPNSTENPIHYVMKHSNGKYYIQLYQSIYEYSGSGSSVTWKMSIASFNVKGFMYELNGKIIIFTGSVFYVINTTTWQLEQTISPANSPSSASMNDFKVFNGFIYAKTGFYHGEIIEIPYDILNTPSPSFRKSSTFFGACIGVSNNYVAVYNTATAKLDIFNRSTFSLIKSLNVAYTNYYDGVFIEEENDAIIFITRGGSTTNAMVQRMKISDGSNDIPIMDIGAETSVSIRAKVYDEQTYFFFFGSRDWQGSYLPKIAKLRSYVTLKK
jgi:hypothetical protein